MERAVTELDVLRNLLERLTGASESLQKKELDRTIREAPSMFRDVFEALRRVEARVTREKISPALACEREIRLLRGADVA
jgi:hypothetical protein